MQEDKIQEELEILYSIVDEYYNPRTLEVVQHFSPIAEAITSKGLPLSEKDENKKTDAKTVINLFKTSLMKISSRLSLMLSEKISTKNDDGYWGSLHSARKYLPNHSSNLVVKLEEKYQKDKLRPAAGISEIELLTGNVNLRGTGTFSDVTDLAHEITHAELFPENFTHKDMLDITCEGPPTAVAALVDSDLKSQNCKTHNSSVNFSHLLLSQKIPQLLDILKNKPKERNPDSIQAAMELLQIVNPDKAAKINSISENSFKESFRNKEENPKAHIGIEKNVFNVFADLQSIINLPRYFVGAAYGITCAENIKNGDYSVDDMLSVYKNEKLTDTQKFDKLGINNETMISAINKYVNKNKGKQKSDRQSI